MVLKKLNIKVGDERIMSIPCDYSPPTTTVCRRQVSLASMALALRSLRQPTAGQVGVTAVLAEQISSVAAWGIWLRETVTKLPCEVLEKGKEKIAREMPWVTKNLNLLCINYWLIKFSISLKVLLAFKSLVVLITFVHWQDRGVLEDKGQHDSLCTIDSL